MKNLLKNPPKTSPGATCVLKPSPFFPGQRSHGSDCGSTGDIRSTGWTLPMVPMDPWVDASISQKMVYDYIEVSRYMKLNLNIM